MKRLNNLYQTICSIENLRLADQKARKGKGNQYGIKVHDKNAEANLQKLHEQLINKTYKTSDYSTFKIYEPKERIISRLPFYPDRIVHHAIMNVLEKIFTDTFTADTYSCIKGRGIHGAANAVKEALKDVPGTQYCLKLDIKKFYPSIDHDILKALLRRKFKDRDLLWLLDEIIDSTSGVPIGNYLSQYFANFYLSGFDHWLKEVKKVKYYFRYADDMIIPAATKEELHQLLLDIKAYLHDNLKLTVKGNHQVFPVAIRGIDFVGYIFFHTHIRIRKRNKQAFARRRHNPKSVVAYMGLLMYGNCRHLIKKVLKIAA